MRKILKRKKKKKRPLYLADVERNYIRFFKIANNNEDRVVIIRKYIDGRFDISYDDCKNWKSFISNGGFAKRIDKDYFYNEIADISNILDDNLDQFYSY